MKGLTKRQKELIDYIQEFIISKGYSPSYREIGDRFGFSSLGSVYKHVNVLKRKGVLQQESHTSRSIAPVAETVIPHNRVEIEIPFIGHIVAEKPVQLFSDSRKMFVSRSFVREPEKTYALRMQGDFLKEEMIIDGDVLLVEVRQLIHPGETVVALINGNDTIVKKYYSEGDHVRLLSTCSLHHPILLRQKDVTVQGVVIGLLRDYKLQFQL
ncbi:MAG: transcriptional repressor LexA [Parachlamydiaceae bacterium]